MRNAVVLSVALAGALLACGSSTTAPTGDGGAGADGSGGSSGGGGAGEGGLTTGDGGNGDATVNGGGDDGSVADSAGGGGGDGSGNDDGATGDGGGTDGGADADAAFLEGPHPALPHVVNYGGPVLRAPKIVTITYTGDANQASFQSFGASATNNAWWNSVRADYCDVDDAGIPTTTCIGDGPTGTSIVLDTVPASPIDDESGSLTQSQMQNYIQSLIPGKIPQPDSNTLLMFYFPSNITITLDGLTSCSGFGGYHNAMIVNGVTFAYAIMPECKVGTTGPTLLQNTTLAASHEIAEAATDPFSAALVGGNTSYYLDYNDSASWAWGDIVGGEVGDMCFDDLGLGQDETTENGFMVQRIWSNAQGAAGHEPCLPAVAAPYYNVAPEKWLITAAVGQTVTFTADAFSDAPMADWVVYGYDLHANSTTNTPYLTIKVQAPGQTIPTATATVGNGDKVTVSVTLNKDPGALAGSAGGAAGMLISLNSATKPTTGHYWPFVVAPLGDQEDAGFIGVDAAMGTPPRMKMSRAQRARLQELVRGAK